MHINTQRTKLYTLSNIYTLRRCQSTIHIYIYIHTQWTKLGPKLDRCLGFAICVVLLFREDLPHILYIHTHVYIYLIYTHIYLIVRETRAAKLIRCPSASAIYSWGGQLFWGTKIKVWASARLLSVIDQIRARKITALTLLTFLVNFSHLHAIKIKIIPRMRNTFGRN